MNNPAHGIAAAVVASAEGSPQIRGEPPLLRPFRYRATDEELEELRRRVMATRFPDKETAPDQSQGPQLATMRELACYWAHEYDWRKVEARLARLPQFLTEIDGLDIHFIHARSRHANALPLIITHGWPGTVIEQLKIVQPLIDPTAHGGDAADAFHVVLPSLPGYGFSGKPALSGWDPARIGRAWATLMARLGYDHYVAQGGDWGGIVTDLMATQGHPGLKGIHTNMPGAVPSAIDQALWAGGPPPEGLAEDELQACGQLAAAYKDVFYAFFMASRPQSLMALADSPVGLAAFLLEPRLFGDLATSAFSGRPDGLSRDDVLDCITFFWLTNSAVSAARLYRENSSSYFVPKGVTLPAAVSVFPQELYRAPRSWTERAYPNLVHYNRVEKGGHFAAWEQPELLVREVRAGFRTLRSA